MKYYLKHCLFLAGLSITSISLFSRYDGHLNGGFNAKTGALESNPNAWLEGLHNKSKFFLSDLNFSSVKDQIENWHPSPVFKLILIIQLIAWLSLINIGKSTRKRDRA
jgi:hypothetical protein